MREKDVVCHCRICMITRHVKEYSVSSISVQFLRKKGCLLQTFARFACFITYKRVVKTVSTVSRFFLFTTHVQHYIKKTNIKKKKKVEGTGFTTRGG